MKNPSIYLKMKVLGAIDVAPGKTRDEIDMRGKQIIVRYERHRKGAVIVYENERRLGQARLLDAVANGLARRRETKD
jgi:hypothetical protein